MLINKAREMTSHDVVAILRRKLKIKRIGHTGTLDPMVTGVLPICIGNATRVSEYIMQQGKTYEGSLKFGKSTSTYDAYGEDVNFSDKISFSRQEILDALEHFTGQIEQSPPVYSAIKVAGKKLYDYARSNQEVEIPIRLVNIYSFELLDLKEDGFSFRLHCSKGTYVRSLVHDLGLYLGTYAYMTDLSRVKVGRFTIDQCIDIRDIDDLSIKDIEDKIIAIEDSLYNLAKIHLQDDVTFKLINGQKINVDKIRYSIEKNNLGQIDFNNIMVFAGEKFLGIGKISNKILKMERVLKSDKSN
ncbi:MAG: tRNA pseudouridine(55) synthase TruB [Tissierellia bacterium]|nr:tRNA pseudouridine(55) synthase TruB [Tissierellia bacterium]